MAGKVITIAQHKGGAGKTTLAAQLSVAHNFPALQLQMRDFILASELFCPGCMPLGQGSLGINIEGNDFGA